MNDALDALIPLSAKPTQKMSDRALFCDLAMVADAAWPYPK